MPNMNSKEIEERQQHIRDANATAVRMQELREAEIRAKMQASDNKSDVDSRAD